MALAVVACAVGLLAVLLALRRDRLMAAPGPQAPDWGPLPLPAEAARADFPLSFPGYDPATVDTHLAALAQAYADLMAAAPPEAVRRARARAAARAGAGPPAPPPGPAASDSGSAGEAPGSAVDGPSDVHGDGGGDDREALRTEAALARLDRGPSETA